MSKSRYENKPFYDPGRFKYSVAFTQQVTETDRSGGVSLAEQELVTCRAVRDRISSRSQLAVQAGASYLNGDTWFIFRKRQDFYPAKDMFMNCEGVRYTIAAVVEEGEPTTYVRVLGKKRV